MVCRPTLVPVLRRCGAVVGVMGECKKLLEGIFTMSEPQQHTRAPLAHQVGLRLTADEFQMVDDLVQQSGLKRSEVLRTLVTGNLQKVVIETTEKTLVEHPEGVEELLNHLLVECHRIGVNVNQMTASGWRGRAEIPPDLSTQMATFGKHVDLFRQLYAGEVVYVHHQDPDNN